MPEFTFIVPYYRQPKMLAHQIKIWEEWPSQIPIIVIDDGSHEQAIDVIFSEASLPLRRRMTLLRVDVDIPWNRGGARNLGVDQAQTEWIVHVDIDHVMFGCQASLLWAWKPDPAYWYRFPRFRRGRADETRRKDDLPDDCEYGPIKPHMDSYLTTKDHYWKSGGYDEDYSGCLGGGTPFTKELAKVKPAAVAPQEMFVEVWTRHIVSDSSEAHLSRDTAEYSRRRQAKERVGNTRPGKHIRFPWHREELI